MIRKVIAIGVDAVEYLHVFHALDQLEIIAELGAPQRRRISGSGAGSNRVGHGLQPDDAGIVLKDLALVSRYVDLALGGAAEIGNGGYAQNIGLGRNQQVIGAAAGHQNDVIGPDRGDRVGNDLPRGLRPERAFDIGLARPAAHDGDGVGAVQAGVVGAGDRVVAEEIVNRGIVSGNRSRVQRIVDIAGVGGIEGNAAPFPGHAHILAHRIQRETSVFLDFRERIGKRKGGLVAEIDLDDTSQQEQADYQGYQNFDQRDTGLSAKGIHWGTITV